jgi:glutathione S-transferase
MITLYDMPLSLNCYKVRLLLLLLEVEYQGEHKSAEFLALNPFGQVFVLSAGDAVMRDSHAMLIWLARSMKMSQKRVSC